MNINLNELLQAFNSEYNFLYDANARGQYVAGQREAAAEFDKTIRTSEQFKNLVCDFVTLRNDFISSDREAAAFMFALDSLN